MECKSKKISIPEMRETLLHSTYLLETRVHALLRERWLWAEANPSYKDPKTDQFSDFDIYSATSVNAGDDEDLIFGALLIECVNNPQPLALMTKDCFSPRLHHLDIKFAGIPVKLMDNKGQWKTLPESLKMQEYHHYYNGFVATQFCSFQHKNTGRKNEWVAVHEGNHFDSIIKLCDVTDYLIERRSNNLTRKNNDDIYIEFYYPVLVLQGDLIEAFANKRSLSVRQSNHLKLRRSVKCGEKQTSYQIDIIKERYLPEYLSRVEEELNQTADLLKHNNKIVRQSINKIIDDIATTNGEIGKVLEYQQ